MTIHFSYYDFILMIRPSFCYFTSYATLVCAHLLYRQNDSRIFEITAERVLFFRFLFFHKNSTPTSHERQQQTSLYAISYLYNEQHVFTITPFSGCLWASSFGKNKALLIKFKHP